MLEPAALPPGITLRVWSVSAPPGTAPLFESAGKWLHPLFELKEFLENNRQIDPGYLILRDRIIGRAAAFLIVQMGIKNVGAEIVSRRALSLFASKGLVPSAGTVVDKISCQTEDLLAGVEDFAEAWQLLSERRTRALARAQSAGS